MTYVATLTSPFNCRWVYREPEGRADSHYAICTRLRLRPRVVCEAECTCCRCWEAADDESPAGERRIG